MATTDEPTQPVTAHQLVADALERAATDLLYQAEDLDGLPLGDTYRRAATAVISLAELPATVAALRATVEFLTDRLYRHHFLLNDLVKAHWSGEWNKFGRRSYHLRYLRGEFTWSDEEVAQVDADIGWCPPAETQVAS